MPQLTLEQRYEISHLKNQGLNNKTVAQQKTIKLLEPWMSFIYTIT